MFFFARHVNKQKNHIECKHIIWVTVIVPLMNPERLRYEIKQAMSIIIPDRTLYTHDAKKKQMTLLPALPLYPFVSRALVFPALLHRLAHTLSIFPAVVLVQVGSFDVRGR